MRRLICLVLAAVLLAGLTDMTLAKKKKGGGGGGGGTRPPPAQPFV